MTLLREPGGIGDAITKIAAELGWGAMSDIARVSEGTVRNWSNDRSRQTPPLGVAMQLDAAYVARCGREPPLFAAYGLHLEVAARPPQDVEAIVAITQAAVKEGAEGVSALAEVIKDPTNPRRRKAARREALEAAEAWSNAANHLDDGADA